MSARILLLSFYFALAALLAFLADHASAQSVAVKGGRLITIAGPDIENGLVLIENGRIAEVGRARDVAFDVDVIDARGKVVMPGFVLAHTQGGVDRANETVENVPFVSVLDSIEPVSPFYENSLRDGIVAMLVIPGNETLIGGQGLIVKPIGRTVEAMTLVRDAGMKISLDPRRGSRMTQMQKLRRALDEMIEYLRKEKAKAESAPDKEEDPGFLNDLDVDLLDVEPRKQAMARLLAGEMPAYIHCGEAADVLRAFEVAEKYKLRATFVLGPKCYKAADHIAKMKVPVILDPELETFETDERSGKEVRKVLPAILHEKGVRFALTTGLLTYGGRYPWYQAAVAARHGVPRDVALRAVTLTAAEILGLSDRLGSLEKGKDGTLLVLSDDPLSGRAFVEKVLIDGVIVYDKAKDRKLKALLTGETSP